MKPSLPRALTVFPIAPAIGFLILSVATVLATERDATEHALAFNDEGTPAKWGSAELGTGATLTYRILTPDDKPVHVRSPSFGLTVTSPEDLLRRNEISGDTLTEELSWALHTWEGPTGIEFVRAEEGERRVDIVFGAASIAGPMQVRDLKGSNKVRAITCLYRVSRKEGPDRIEAAVIVLNLDVPWTEERLRPVLEHEIGHALGLGHNSSHEHSLMNCIGMLPPLSYEDVRAARFLYGRGTPPEEKKETLARTE